MQTDRVEGEITSPFNTQMSRELKLERKPGRNSKLGRRTKKNAARDGCRKSSTVRAGGADGWGLLSSLSHAHIVTRVLVITPFFSFPRPALLQADGDADAAAENKTAPATQVSGNEALT